MLQRLIGRSFLEALWNLTWAEHFLKEGRVFGVWASADGSHPGVELRENLESISHRYHLFEVAFVWKLTKETIHLPLGCLQGGAGPTSARHIRYRGTSLIRNTHPPRITIGP